jgi:hypothetical protein
MKTHSFARCGAVAVALALLAPDARALEIGGRSVDLGVAAGVLMQGPIQVAWHSTFDPDSTWELTNPSTLLLSGMFDVEVAPRLSLGGRVNTATVEIERDLDLGYYEFDGQNHVLNRGTIRIVELALSAKLRFRVNDRMRLQPALYVGYIKAFADDPDARNTGLGLNASLEGRYAVGEKAFLFGEMGLMTQVYGGVEHIGYARTKYPLACFTVGAGF